MSMAFLNSFSIFIIPFLNLVSLGLKGSVSLFTFSGEFTYFFFFFWWGIVPLLLQFAYISFALWVYDKHLPTVGLKGYLHVGTSLGSLFWFKLFWRECCFWFGCLVSLSSACEASYPFDNVCVGHGLPMRRGNMWCLVTVLSITWQF